MSADHNGNAKALAYRKLKQIDPEEAEKFIDYASFYALMDKPAPTVIVNGVVGNLNLGTQVGHIETALEVAWKQGIEGADFANALKTITDQVLACKDLEDQRKSEIVDSLAFISEEAQSPPEKRKLAVLKSVIESIPKILSSAASLSTLWTKYGPFIAGYLGL